MADLMFPAPVSADAPQPAMVAPPSVKFTAPFGFEPVTVAVKVTVAPTRAGFAGLATVVVVAVVPTAETCTDNAEGDADNTLMVMLFALST